MNNLAKQCELKAQIITLLELETILVEKRTKLEAECAELEAEE